MGLRRYILRHPAMVAGALCALVVSAAAMLTVPIAVRRMIDHGFTASDGTIDWYFGALVVIGFVLAVASAARMYTVNWLGERVVADLRSEVFAHVATLGPAFFDRTHSGDIMSRLIADTTQIKSAAGSTLSQALRNAIMLVGALALMFITSPTLSLLALAAIPAIVFPLLAYGRLVRRLSRSAQDRLADASAYAADNLAAVRAMHAFGQEGTVSGRFAKVVEKAFDAARTRLAARAGLTAVAMFLVVASIVAILWFGSHLVIGGSISGGRLGQFILYAVFAAGAVAELAEVWGELAQASGATERLMQLLAIEPQIASPPNPVRLPSPPRGTIAFEDVRFSYPMRETERSLNGVSFSIAPGETVAIVGPSGAGKSTLFNLILRYYDPVAGRVLLDGVNIRNADLREARARIALVPQDTVLFDDTVAENIRYGRPDATDAEMRAAAAAAQAAGFIQALPESYSTRLGERGLSLSGGQRQRIAIARAMVLKPKFVVLDEPTSALDMSVQAQIVELLRDLQARHNLAYLFISHDLRVVRALADEVIVMKDGKVVEAGSADDIFEAPKTPYTQALMAAAFNLEVANAGAVRT